MTSETARSSAVVSSIAEFGAGPDADRSAGQAPVTQIPRDDVLEYIQEMCATLSYMSVAHGCDRLSGLFAAAANEAANCRQLGARAERSANPKASRVYPGDEPPLAAPDAPKDVRKET